MGITDERFIYKPLEYQVAEDFFITQEKAHWLWSEVNMSSDKNDWSENLNESEKNLIGYILKGFTQTELIVEDYWSTKVLKWFPKPEIAMMCASFANMEAIHTKSYSYLNDTLDLYDYEGFMHEPEIRKRLDRLMNIKETFFTKVIDFLFKKKALKRKALSLAVFSAFTEGVTLYSSFAILLNFSRKNLLKGVAQIIQFSIKDESLHSDAGIWLFKTLVGENPNILDKDLIGKIYDAARLTVAMEYDFIDKAFETDEIAGMNKNSLKNFILYRANERLVQLGLFPLFAVNNEILKDFEWFDILAGGSVKADFFAARENNYTKSGVNWDDI